MSSTYPHYEAPIQLYDVVFIIVPRLDRAQKLVNRTLDTLIEGATDPKDLTKRLEQRRDFTLELQAIHTNLEHLLERYRPDVKDLLRTSGMSGNRTVEPDDMEQDAIERAKEIYRKVVEFQTGRRNVPF
ncbi:hypothetical protein [Vreelandella massiliensis]|uniref:hypothetical protein n=1 Tax=Vreelandella massiliensis TaxID=1816686 RepID=UPI00096A9880|nr:hypothetical protein [Halomonas massiliensis]